MISPIARFSLPILAWLFVYHQSLQSMVLVWTQSKTYEHGFVIIPIVLWLTWRKREQIKQFDTSTAWLPIVLITIPTVLWMLGRAADIALFEHISAIVSLQLLLWAILGTPLIRVLIFPISYLIFCVPFGEELIPYLQVITADITVFALKLSNIPVYREGLFITIPNGSFEVAEACSGIRFLISSLALGTLFAHLHFRKKWKAIVFILFSFCFPIIANGIRAYGIVLIGHLTNVEYATGADHLIYGWLFFSLVIGVIFYVASHFADKDETESQIQPFVGLHKVQSRTVITTLCLVAIFCFQLVWQESLKVTSSMAVNAITLPKNTTQIDSSAWGISFPQAIRISQGITSDGHIEYFSARYLLRQETGELISSSNHIYGQDKWSVSTNTKTEISSKSYHSFNATLLTVANHRGQSMKILYWYCVDNICSSNPMKIKLIKAFTLMTNRSGTADILALASFSLTDAQLQQAAMAWIASENDQ